MFPELTRAEVLAVAAALAGAVGEPPRMTDRDPMTKPLNVGVVGLGYWGPNLLRALAEMPDAHLRWMCDLDEQLLDGLGRRYPGPARTTEVGRLLEDPDVDAIVLATPVFTHFDLASRSLDAGKHTFVEKPLAPSSDLASELLGEPRIRTEC